ncbi:hypothetical protein T190820D02B_10136 [Tenacibaculum sp. 190524A05c]
MEIPTEFPRRFVLAKYIAKFTQQTIRQYVAINLKIERN